MQVTRPVRVKIYSAVGAAIGGCLCLVVAGIVLLRFLGGARGAPLAVAATLGRAALFYLVGGSSVGALLGVVAPLGRNLIGAVLIGAAVGVPLMAGAHWVAVAVDPVRAGPLDIISDLPFSLTMGALYGLVSWVAIRSVRDKA